MADQQQGPAPEGERKQPDREAEKKPPRPARVKRKPAEPPGNLRKREEWFRKRSG